MNIYFGVATKSFALYIDSIPGGDVGESWAFERSSGKRGHRGEWDYYASLPFAKVGDTIGIYLSKGILYFYSNGKSMGPAFQDPRFLKEDLYPVVGLFYPEDKVTII